MRIATRTRIDGIEIAVADSVDPLELRPVLEHATHGSPFSVQVVLPDVDGWRCRFVPAHPEMALGWSNTIALQSVVARFVEVVAVRRLTPDDAFGRPAA